MNHKRQEPKIDLTAASEAAFAHARGCRNCCWPIVNGEGNPQYLGEACTEGQKILQTLLDAEQNYFARRRHP